MLHDSVLLSVEAAMNVVLMECYCVITFGRLKLFLGT